MAAVFVLAPVTSNNSLNRASSRFNVVRISSLPTFPYALYACLMHTSNLHLSLKSRKIFFPDAEWR